MAAFLLLCVLLACSASSGATLDQGIRCCDPAAITAPDGRTAFVFGTGRNLTFWRSKNLREWERVGSVFPDSLPAWTKAKVPRANAFWAPDISLWNGRYHLYYSVSSWGSQRSVIGLAVGKSLDPASSDYGWEDRGLVVESAPGKTNFNAIDPALFVDRDGMPYLFWGSFWSGIKAARVDPATGKLAKGSGIASIAGRERGAHPPSIEAPYVIRRDGHYYLFVSWGVTCQGKNSTYRVMVGRSEKVLGPYVDFHGVPMSRGGGTLVLGNHEEIHGPGHNSVLRTCRGDWLFHHVEARRWRVLQIRPIYWLSGWPVVGEPLGNTDKLARMRMALSDFAGAWRHGVDYGSSRSIELSRDGTIVGTRARWSREDGCVVFRWPSEDAPGGVWVDRVVVGYDGQSYVGRNQRGQAIRGVRE